MMSYSFTFWQVLIMLFMMYRLGINVGFKRGRRVDEPEIVKIDIEKHGETLFAYEHGTKKFVAQGIGYEALQQSLKVLEPNITFVASNEQVAEFGGKNAESL